MIKRIDFHTHILPSMDDGSNSAEESIQMLNMLSKAKVETVVLSPHFYPDSDYPSSFLSKREESFRILKEAIGTQKVPKLLLGAEIAYFDGIGTSDIMKELVIEGTNYLLIELPFSGWNARIFENIFRLSNRIHIVPILAHIDRYHLKRSDRKLLQKYLEEGGIIQGNADFFLNKKTEKKAFKLFDKGVIQILGSDCHHIVQRAPLIGKAFDIIDKKASAAAIDESNKIATLVLDSIHKEG